MGSNVGEIFCADYDIPDNCNLNPDGIFRLRIDPDVDDAFTADPTRQFGKLQIIDNEGELTMGVKVV